MSTHNLKILQRFISVAKIHDLKIDETLELNLYNNQRSPVDAETFPIIVQQYQHDSGFFLEIAIGGSNSWTVSTEVDYFQSVFIFIN